MESRCPKCNKLFPSVYTLQNHLNRKNPCNILILCVLCKKQFKYNSDLVRHINNKKACVPVTTDIVQLYDPYVPPVVLTPILDSIDNFNAMSYSNYQDPVLPQCHSQDFNTEEDFYVNHTDFCLPIKKEECMPPDTIENNDFFILDNNFFKSFDPIHVVNDDFTKACNIIKTRAPFIIQEFNIDTVFDNYYDIFKNRTEEYYNETYRKSINMQQIIGNVLKEILNNFRYPTYGNIYYIFKIDTFCTILYDKNTLEKTVVKIDYKKVFRILVPIMDICFKIYTGKQFNLVRYKYTLKYNKSELGINIYDNGIEDDAIKKIKDNNSDVLAELNAVIKNAVKNIHI